MQNAAENSKLENLVWNFVEPANSSYFVGLRWGFRSGNRLARSYNCI